MSQTLPNGLINLTIDELKLNLSNAPPLPSTLQSISIEFIQQSALLEDLLKILPPSLLEFKLSQSYSDVQSMNVLQLPRQLQLLRLPYYLNLTEDLRVFTNLVYANIP